MALNLIDPSTRLDSMGSFTQGTSIGNAIAQRNYEQQQLQMQQEQVAFQRAQLEKQAQQQEALRQLSIEAFNNPEALRSVYSRDRELGESIAKERDKYNRITSGIITDVVDAPIEKRQKNWDLARATLEQRGIATDDLPKEYSPEVESLLKMKQKELRTWDNTFKALETDRGLMMIDEKSGEITPTGYGVYRKPPETIVNVNNTGEGELYKKARGAQGEIYGDYIKQGNKASANIATLNRAEELIDKIGTTGKLTPASAALGNVLNQFGIKVDTKKIGNIEDLTQLAQTQIGQILGSGEYGSGTGVSGVDLNAAKQRVFGADKTPQGNKQIIVTLKALEERKKEAGRLVSRLINEGKATEIDAALDELSKKPIFKEEEKKSSTGSVISYKDYFK